MRPPLISTTTGVMACAGAAATAAPPPVGIFTAWFSARKLGLIIRGFATSRSSSVRPARYPMPSIVSPSCTRYVPAGILTWVAVAVGVLVGCGVVVGLTVAVGVLVAVGLASSKTAAAGLRVALAPGVTTPTGAVSS